MRAHLGGSSRASLVAARIALDAAVKGVDAKTASTLSSELFFITDVLGSNISKYSTSEVGSLVKSEIVRMKEEDSYRPK